MNANRKTLVTLALVAIVGVGLVGAYASNACDAAKGAASASHASAGKDACCAAKGAAHASAPKGACTFDAHKASAGRDACGSATGVLQASAAGIPVGAGSACPHGKSAGAPSCAKGSMATADCDGCRLYMKYCGALQSASREVATLPDGILVRLTTTEESAVSDLRNYSREKAELMRAIANKTFEGKLCGYCEEKSRSMRGASFRVADAENGVYTVITSGAPETVRELHKIAAAEAATSRAADRG